MATCTPMLIVRQKINVNNVAAFFLVNTKNFDRVMTHLAVIKTSI